jgi:hypothetical protein
MLPPFTLPSPTTITWPPFETTFLSIGGGNTGSWVKEKTSMISGTVTKITETVITVDGASIATITSKISIPPFTTDRINFYPVTVDQTDSAGESFEPVPSITPPSFMLELPPGVRTFPPTPFTYDGEPPPPSRTSDSTPLWFSYPSSSRRWTIQPQPTVPVPLPRDLPKPSEECTTVTTSLDEREDCKRSYWPTLATFTPVPPRQTCDIPMWCGSKNCATFGCGCGPLGLVVGPG